MARETQIFVEEVKIPDDGENKCSKPFGTTTKRFARIFESLRLSWEALALVICGRVCAIEKCYEAPLQVRPNMIPSVEAVFVKLCRERQRPTGQPKS